MDSSILWFVLKVLGCCAALYVATAIGFLATVRLKRDEEGQLIFDPHSWHFKFIYPLKGKILAAQEAQIGICRYCGKFFWMLWLGWPLLLIWETMRIVVCFPFAFLFGFVIVPGMESFRKGVRALADTPNGIFAFKVLRMAVGGRRIYPIFFAIPAVFAWFLRYHFAGTMHITIGVLASVVVIALIAGLIIVLGWFRETDQQSVSLAREWFIARKRGMCPIGKVKATPRPS